MDNADLAIAKFEELGLERIHLNDKYGKFASGYLMRNDKAFRIEFLQYGDRNQIKIAYWLNNKECHMSMPTDDFLKLTRSQIDIMHGQVASAEVDLIDAQMRVKAIPRDLKDTIRETFAL